MPVAAVSGQATHLDTHHDPDMTKRHFRQQSLESSASFQALSADSQVVVDGDDLFGGPAIGCDQIGKVVLQPGRLDILAHLTRARLTNIDDRQTSQVLIVNLAEF